MRLSTDLQAVLERTVAEADTAAAVGSGSLPVLGTPVLLAWCEAATCAALEPALDAGETSVGTRVELEHRAPTPVGGSVEVHASQAYVDGRLVRFSVAVRNVGETGRMVVQMLADVEGYRSSQPEPRPDTLDRDSGFQRVRAVDRARCHGAGLRHAWDSGLRRLRGGSGRTGNGFGS